MAGKCFSITKNRIEAGYHPGFVPGEDGELVAEQKSGEHYMFLKAIDSGEEDANWGKIQVYSN